MEYFAESKLKFFLYYLGENKINGDALSSLIRAKWKYLKWLFIGIVNIIRF